MVSPISKLKSRPDLKMRCNQLAGCSLMEPLIEQLINEKLESYNYANK